MKTRIASRFVLIAIALATIGCDRVTKHVATTLLSGDPVRSYFGDTVRLAYAHNTGGFLSLGADWPTPVRTAVFTVGTGVLLLLLLVLASKRRWAPMAKLGIALFAAGAASNGIDRVLHGSVIDFLNVGIGPVRTGIFNVADVALMLGGALVVIAEARGRRGIDKLTHLTIDALRASQLPIVWLSMCQCVNASICQCYDSPMQAVDESALAESVRAGDAAAFETLIRRETPRLLSVARRILGNDDETREAVHQGFIAAYRAREQFQGDARLSTWLHRIVVNKALDRAASPAAAS